MNLRISVGFVALVAAAAASVSPAAAAGIVDSARAPSAQLERVDATTSLGTRFVRYRQEVGGIPVLGSEAVVSNGPGANDLLLDSTRRGVRDPGAARVGEARAIAAARRGARVRSLRADATATHAILPGDPDRLVWQVVLPAREPLGSFEVLVDARSGDVVRVRDLRRRASGSASLFDPNPIETGGDPLVLDDNGDATSPALEAQQQPVTLPRLDGSGDCLTGTWVRARLPGDDPVCGGPDWSAVTRDDNQFEALMAYFHLDRTQAYIHSLGFTNVMNRRIAVNADDMPDDNSWYDPGVGAGEIFLGTGGVDDGEDADVVVHEYGHAVQDDQVPGFGPPDSEAGAMGEGFGDYLAAAMSANHSPSATFDACLGEWDIFPFGDECLRRADETVTKSDLAFCGAEVHCVAPVWSGALWEIRSQIGGAAADRLVIQSQFALTANATFTQAGQALLQADDSLYGGSHRTTILSALGKRELFDPERLDDTPATATPLAVPGSATGTVSASSDPHDVYRVSLHAGQGVTFRTTGSGELNLRLVRPGAASVNDSAGLLAASSTVGANETIGYVAPADGDYFVDVNGLVGSATYRLDALPDDDGDGVENAADNCRTSSNAGQQDGDGDRTGDACDPFPGDALNDADHDGHGADADNCPTVSNPGQQDWDGDGDGDDCDTSASLTGLRASHRGRLARLSVRVRPAQLVAARRVRFRIDRRACSHCRWRRVATVRGKSKKGTRVLAKRRLRHGGRYRVVATLADSRLRARRTRPRTFGM